MVDAGFACGVSRAHLEQRVDEGACFEVFAPKPLVECVEDGEKLLLRSGPAAFRLCLDKLHRPALLAASEEGDNEVVLGGEVSVERGLGDTGARDYLVDADVSDAAAREEF